MSEHSDDDWEDVEWANELLEEMHSVPAVSSGTPAPKAVKTAKPPRKASGDARRLEFCTDSSPEKVLQALEDINLYRNVQTLRNLLTFLYKKSNDGFAVWEHLKPYHANLLAYQVAMGIQTSTLDSVEMIRASYDVIIHVMEDSVRSVDAGAVYTQWVGRESVDEFTNISIIFDFLRERDEQIKGTAGPGKLP